MPVVDTKSMLNSQQIPHEEYILSGLDTIECAIKGQHHINSLRLSDAYMH